jgi:hypothetical protein
MRGCSLLLTPEVRAWLAALGDDDFGRVAFYLDLLRQRQGELAPPYSRCLSGQLCQLEIPGRRRTHRLTYCAGGDGTIVVLTVWRRWRGTGHELARAAATMGRRSSPAAGRSERGADESR